MARYDKAIVTGMMKRIGIHQTVRPTRPASMARAHRVFTPATEP